MATMQDMIERLCGDDQPLCESILYLYKHFGDASIKDALWKQIEEKHAEGKLSRVLAQKGSFVPTGVTCVIDGTYVRLYAGHGNDTQVAKYNTGVGDHKVDRLAINIAPYIWKFTRAHDIDYYSMVHHPDKASYYNELAYQIIKYSLDDICAKVNAALHRNSDQQQFINKNVEAQKEMYSTDAAEKVPDPAPVTV